MAKTVEFGLVTDLRAYDTMQIEATFDQTLAGLVEMMNPYAGVVVTEADVPTAKSDLAKIRKVKARIEDVRKDVKRQIMAPYTRFEERCKELTAVCEKAETNLDQQIKGYAESAKGEKRERLALFFRENIGDMADYLTFDVIYNKRWENATYDEAKAQDDIQKCINICRNSVNAIRGLNSEYETALLDYYRETHSLEAVLQKNNDLKARAEAERKRRETAIAAVQKPEPARPEPPVQKPQEAPKPQTAKEKVYTLDFRVSGTAEQIDELRKFLIRTGMSFGKVPKEG